MKGRLELLNQTQIQDHVVLTIEVSFFRLSEATKAYDQLLNVLGAIELPDATLGTTTSSDIFVDWEVLLGKVSEAIAASIREE